MTYDKDTGMIIAQPDLGLGVDSNDLADKLVKIKRCCHVD